MPRIDLNGTPGRYGYVKLAVDSGECEQCGRRDVAVLLVDGSGDDFSPGTVCQRCVLLAFALANFSDPDSVLDQYRKAAGWKAPR